MLIKEILTKIVVLLELSLPKNKKYLLITYSNDLDEIEISSNGSHEDTIELLKIVTSV